MRQQTTSLLITLLYLSSDCEAFSSNLARTKVTHLQSNFHLGRAFAAVAKDGSTPKQSPLFASNYNTINKKSVMRKLVDQTLKVTKQLHCIRTCFTKRLRRGMVLLLAASLFWIGSAGVHVKASHASTAKVTSQIERIMSSTSRSLENIVDSYTRDHMFDDDKYDPVESLYREAYDDATKGSYPQALREVTASALGQDAGKASSRDAEGSGIGFYLAKAISTLQKRGLSESSAVALLAAMFVVAGPSVFLFVGMIVGGMSKRNINKVMKQRYGDTYTVDATIKKEDDVEAPDDEVDDDDEEEDDDDDDDDGEDDDDDDAKDKKDKKR